MGKPDITDVVGELPTANPQYRVTRTRSEIRKLVVHYDAQQVRLPYDPLHRYKAQARYHIQKDWGTDPTHPVHGFGLMYHYRVDYMGGIWQVQPETLITWHSHDGNGTGLAVCCDLGDGQQPSQKQIAALYALLDWLCYERPDIPAGREDVRGHQEVPGNATPCPGNMLPLVRAYRSGQVGGPTQRERLFPETGKTVSGNFLKFYDERGGVAIFGYPITNSRRETLGDGREYDVQYFERARFEDHGGIVGLGRVGAELLQCKGGG